MYQECIPFIFHTLLGTLCVESLYMYFSSDHSQDQSWGKIYMMVRKLVALFLSPPKY